MCFCEEVVGINTCGKHSCNFSYILVWLNSSCKNYHICFHKDLFVLKKVRSLNHKGSVWLRDHLSNLALDIIYAVILNCSSVELIEVFTWGTDINVKYGYVCIRIFVADQHGMLCCVHTADLGAVALSSFVGAAASNALYENNVLRSFSIGKSLKMTFCRSCCIHNTLKLKGCDDVLALAVSVLIIFIKRDHIETGCNYDCAVFLCNDLILLLVIDCAGCAGLGAGTAFSGFELDAVLTVDYRNIWDCLGKRNVNSTSVVQAAVKFVWIFLGRTFGGADTASCTFVHIYASCFFTDIYGEVTNEAAYFFNFTICVNVDFLMCCSFYHFRGKNTCRTVKCWECLIKL
ncbi:unknown [Ruminococcus sp. CAG:60]|nr:unknown [Ruminococcus sp. CAG:60]